MTLDERIKAAQEKVDELSKQRMARSALTRRIEDIDERLENAKEKLAELLAELQTAATDPAIVVPVAPPLIDLISVQAEIAAFLNNRSGGWTVTVVDIGDGQADARLVFERGDCRKEHDVRIAYVEGEVLIEFSEDDWESLDELWQLLYWDVVSGR